MLIAPDPFDRIFNGAVYLDLQERIEAYVMEIIKEIRNEEPKKSRPWIRKYNDYWEIYFTIKVLRELQEKSSSE